MKRPKGMSYKKYRAKRRLENLKLKMTLRYGSQVRAAYANVEAATHAMKRAARWVCNHPGEDKPLSHIVDKMRYAGL